MSDNPWLLDLFAGAGGAGEGYRRAGFHVVGVDLDPKPLRHNPHECYQGDALEVLDTLLAGGTWQCYRLADFDAIHASPPCQDYSYGAALSGNRNTGNAAPRLLIPVRNRLKATGLLWALENVRGAMDEMENPLILCGTTLGIRVRRHRLFDCSHLIFGAGPCQHRPGDVSVRKKRAEYCDIHSARSYVDGKGYTRWAPKSCRVADTRLAMGIPWMNSEELGEAIPPAYTEWIGRQLLAAIPERTRKEATA